MKDYYKILEVHRDATQKMIDDAFKACSFKYHPDKRPEDPEHFTEVIKEVNEAYEILKDPIKRAEYDAKLNLEERSVGGNLRNTNLPLKNRLQKNFVIAVVTVAIAVAAILAIYVGYMGSPSIGATIDSNNDNIVNKEIDSSFDANSTSYLEIGMESAGITLEQVKNVYGQKEKYASNGISNIFIIDEKLPQNAPLPIPANVGKDGRIRFQYFVDVSDDITPSAHCSDVRLFVYVDDVYIGSTKWLGYEGRYPLLSTDTGKIVMSSFPIGNATIGLLPASRPGGCYDKVGEYLSPWGGTIVLFS